MTEARTKPMSEQQTTNFPRTRCEFCDITFKCDLDVSRHLNSPTHREKREKFIPYSNPAKVQKTQKEVPKNISQLFERSIKVKNMKDIRDLADKGYFQIKTHDHAVCDVAQALAKKLMQNIVKFESKPFPDLAAMFENAFKSPDNVEANNGQEEARVEESMEVDSSLPERSTTRAMHEPSTAQVARKRKTPSDANPPPNNLVRSSSTRSNTLTSTSSPQPSTSARADAITTHSRVPSRGVVSEASTAAPTSSTSAQPGTNPRIQNPDTNPNPASTYKPSVGFWPGVKVKEEPKDD